MDYSRAVPSNDRAVQPRSATLMADLAWTLLNRATALPGENSTDDVSAQRRREALVRADLDAAAALKPPTGISDEEFWARAAIKPFYAGKRASLIRPSEPYMLSLLRDPEELCSAEWNPRTGSRFQAFLNDERCVPNPLSLERTIQCARRMQNIKRTNPGKSLIDFYVRASDWSTPSPMLTIHSRLCSHIDLGYVTSLHFMTDLGLPVVKPDRVVNRLAIRLGIITGYEMRGRRHHLPLTITGAAAETLGKKPQFNWPLQEAFSQIARETNLTMRTVDLILVKMGQQPDEAAGYARTVCGDVPLCGLCRARPQCAYGRSPGLPHKM